MSSLISKGRKPKFDLHLKIYDLNNVPLVSGTSSVKWQLQHSIHAEHKGRTPRAHIANHRVDYGYARVVPSVRIAIDRSGNLSECPIEFEVLQEYKHHDGNGTAATTGGGGREEKIVLGVVRLNLSEYVEESDGMAREMGPSGPASAGPTSSTSTVLANSGAHAYRKRTNSMGTTSTGDTTGSESRMGSRGADVDVEDGIVRRYLMQDSKINSTLKIGILMIQTDGERNYIAPPLKTAPVFGGIAGILTGDKSEQPDDAGQIPTISKSRDGSEAQDMYRRTLVASWTRHADELPADECIEDIFAGGDGWKFSPSSSQSQARSPPASPRIRGRNDGRTNGGSVANIHDLSDSSDEPHLRHHHHHNHNHHHHLFGGGGGSMANGYGRHHSFGFSTDTLRPADMRRMHTSGPLSPVRRSNSTVRPAGHQRKHSGASADKASILTMAAAASSAPVLSDMSGRRGGLVPPSLTAIAAVGGGYDGAEEDDVPAAAAWGTGSNHRHLSVGSDFGNADKQQSRSRSHSLVSLTPTTASKGSDKARYGEGGARRAREVDEKEVRDDLVAWAKPERVASS